MTYNKEYYGFGLDVVAPYAHPQHWNGHSFGQGEVTASQAGKTAPRAAVEFSQQILTRFLNHHEPRCTVQTFRSGQTFNAEVYTEGTILAFRQEGLYTDKLRRAKRLLDGVDCDPPAVNQGLPAATKDFAPYCLTLQDEQKVGGGVINYWNKAVWGVITADRKGDPLVVRTPPAFIGFWPDTVTVGASASRLSSIVTLGEVQHTRRGAYERLARVFMLEVCAFGQVRAQEQPSNFPGMVRRPGEGLA